MANRHLSRSIVLQTLFEWDFMSSGKDEESFPSEKVATTLSRNLKEFGPGLEDDAFVESLVDLVLKKRKMKKSSILTVVIRMKRLCLPLKQVVSVAVLTL